MILLRLIAAWFLIFCLAISAKAQNTGGVFPPTVNEDHRSVQWRLAVDPDNADGDARYATRLHYQQAINGDFMWRVIGQIRNTASKDVDLDFLQGELFWEWSQDSNPHDHGIRFDARLRDGNRPEQLGLNFMNHFNLGDGWTARALALTFVQLGDNAADGVNLQSRFRIARRFPNKLTLGVEVYNNYGNTRNIGDFDDQNHTIGPFLAAPLTEGISIFAGPLFGLSEAAADVEGRVWLTRQF